MARRSSGLIYTACSTVVLASGSCVAFTMPSGMQIPGFPSFPDLPDDDGESGFTTTTGSTSSKAMCETRATSSSLSISQDTYQEA
eukprot:jgi/Ulvmu1/12517/UM090_0004.1